MAKEEDHSRLLAGLCYVPFALINLVVILYVLLANKGGKYAKYHALQGLALLLALFVLNMLFSVFFLLPMMQNLMTTQIQLAQSLKDNSTAAATAPIQVMGQMYMAMLPMMLFGLGVLAIGLALTVAVALGKDVRIPILKGFLMRFV
ncbi:Uncharacterised protein [uncultured archaeon]|nr:Uncharacterised protein [uncultured archaeon]